MSKRRKGFSLVLMLTIFTIFSTAGLFADGYWPELVELDNGVVDKGILIFESSDGMFKYWFDARVQWDFAAYFEGDNNMTNGAEMRRGTFALKSTLYRDWEAEVDIGFGRGELGLRDFWVKYNFPGHNGTMQAGYFKEAFGLERLTSSRMLTFIERAGDAVFEPGRLKGISYNYWGRNWATTVGLYGQDVEDNRFDDDSEAWGVNGRFTMAPVMEDGLIAHIGASGSYRVPDADNNDRVRFRARPESRVDGQRVINTGHIGNVDDYIRFGVEGGLVYGPWQFQGEYKGVMINRYDDKDEEGASIKVDDASLFGYYAFLSYFITGESRGYDVADGEFSAFHAPKNKWGALQLALRYSHTELTDEDAGVFGGAIDQITFGVNWYFNRNVKLQLNYSMVDLDKYSSFGEDSFSFVHLRLTARI